ncbi:MAG: protein-glutamate O-methyltransferase CheR [Vicinamibacterales bacterium]|jgi:chemotaxis protein methyltransferase CheR|nr:protein-glutamate O-methyltransferase CheR [Vicinamibacterales bacterium]
MGISDLDFDFVRTFIRAQAGIVLGANKAYLAEARLSPLAREEGFADLPELVDALRAGSLVPLNRKVVDALTTHETSFFRDREPFEALRTRIIPELIASRQDERRLNFWYAASSTGQEPYSVVMLLAEHFPELASWNVSHLGTDISAMALDRARRGRFGQVDVNRGLPDTYLVKYFVGNSLDWVLKDHIRKAVRFEELNLLEDWPALPTMDVIMMRNVMLYFDADGKRTTLAKVGRVLHPEGYLFLGPAETTMDLEGQFERVKDNRAGCYRSKARYQQAS